ncbi:hypothetical protein [Streptomyces sp. NPDC059994]
MDEPSAALDPDETDNLFRTVGDLTSARRAAPPHPEQAPASRDVTHN